MGRSVAVLSVNVDNAGRSLLRDIYLLLVRVLIHVTGKEPVVLSESIAHAARDRDSRNRAEAVISFMALDKVV